MSMRVAVLGAGNWGAALADLISKNGHRVVVWARRDEVAEEINRKHTSGRSPQGTRLHHKVRATPDLKEAVTRAEVVLAVVPSQEFRGVARRLGDFLEPDQIVLHATKGLEIATKKRMSEVLAEETAARFIGVVSGPNLSREVVAGHPSATVIASPFERVVELGAPLLAGPRFRVFISRDVVGVELGGAFKNVFAIAAGAAAGLGFGDNTKAFLVTRGLAEMTRLAVRLGAERETLVGLSGLGDLMVTCAGMLSRNFQVGFRHAKGERIPHILESLGAVAEGVPNALVAKELADSFRLDLPLVSAVYAVVHQARNTREAMKELLSIHARHETERAPSGTD